MNKTEKLICLFLGLALVWCFMTGRDVVRPAEAPETGAAAEEVSAPTNAPAAVAASPAGTVADAVSAAEVKSAVVIA